MSLRLRVVAATGLVAATVLTLGPVRADAASFTVDTAVDSVDATPGDGICADVGGGCSLRAAVQEANASAGADTISLGAAGSALNLSGAAEEAAATGDLDVTSEITLVGTGNPTITALGLDDRAFDVKAGATLRLQGVVVSGGTAVDVPTASGGAVLSAGTLEVTDSTLRDNRANRAGGAIEASAGSTTTITSSALVGNDTGASPGNGGGFHLTGAGTVTVTDSLVAENTAANEGGGLWNSAAGTMTVTRTEIHSNTAAGATAANGGGGIFNQPNADATGGGTLNVIDSNIHDNAASGMAGSGGGLFNSRGVVTISGTTFAGNVAVRAGGAIEALAGSTTITNSDFTGNTTGTGPGNGGALHLTGPGTVSISGGTASGNDAANEGGAFWNSAVGTMTITDVDILDNIARGDSFTAPDFEGGGGVFNDGSVPEVGPPVGGTLTISGGRIVGNTATVGSGSGGGILNVAGTLDVTGTEIRENTSARAGGGIESQGGSTTLTGVTLADNDTGASPGNGGGFHLTGAGTVAVTASEVFGNTAANEGGGLWVSAAGSMTVERSSITDNTASGEASDSGGGGLYNDGGTLAVTNTVVNNNDAGTGGGVLDVNDGDTTLTHVTVTGNTAATGSGVASLGETITLANSIVAGNTGSADCAGNVLSSGGNVLGGCTLGNADDLEGVANPALGGDLVPLPGSPAIDAGLPANSLPTDLAGVARPIDGNGDGVAVSDAGALEAPAPGGPVDTTTTTTTTPGTPDTTAPSTTVPGTTVPPTTDTTLPPTEPTVPGPVDPEPTIPPVDPGTPVPPVGPGTPVAPAPGGVGGGNVGGGVAELPRTGSSNGPLVAVGLSLVTLGAGLLALRGRARLVTARR